MTRRRATVLTVAALAVTGAVSGLLLARVGWQCRYFNKESAAFFLLRDGEAVVILKPAWLTDTLGSNWENVSIFWQVDRALFPGKGTGAIHGNQMHPLSKQVPAIVFGDSRWDRPRFRLFIAEQRSMGVFEVDLRTRRIAVVSGLAPLEGELLELETGDLLISPSLPK